MLQVDEEDADDRGVDDRRREDDQFDLRSFSHGEIQRRKKGIAALGRKRG